MFPVQFRRTTMPVWKVRDLLENLRDLIRPGKRILFVIDNPKWVRILGYVFCRSDFHTNIILPPETENQAYILHPCLLDFKPQVLCLVTAKDLSKSPTTFRVVKEFGMEMLTQQI